MPRQPFPKGTPGWTFMGREGMWEQRPKLFSLVGECLIAWPAVEAEMALVLGHLLGANHPLTLAIFQILRRSSSQRDALEEAAKNLPEKDRELLSAILNVHKSIEAERNALTHGHLGIHSESLDVILWMNTADYISFKSHLVLVPEGIREPSKYAFELSYYREPDLRTILTEIRSMGATWAKFIQYLQSKDAELYSQLCDQSRIAQELEKLRQKNNPSTQPQSQPPSGGEK